MQLKALDYSGFQAERIVRFFLPLVWASAQRIVMSKSRSEDGRQKILGRVGLSGLEATQAQCDSVTVLGFSTPRG